jgi:3,4-dihydroxy 2-butanone 4-phosphate synthase/GTP cyclohydrolase II
LKRIAAETSGVLVVLRDHESPRELADAIQGLRSPEPAQATDQAQAVLRTYGIGAQILKDLGVRRMRVLSAPKQLHGISAFDLEVAEYVSD